MPPDAPYISGLTLGSLTVLGLRAEAPKVPAGEAAMFVQINRTKKNRRINKLICIVCVCNVFSSEINSTELEARNPLTPLRGGYAGYQNL